MKNLVSLNECCILSIFLLNAESQRKDLEDNLADAVTTCDAADIATKNNASIQIMMAKQQVMVLHPFICLILLN